MKIKLSICFLSAFLIACFSGGNAQVPNESEENPAEVLVAYYDAVNAKQYRRAYDLWRNPPESYDDFVKGYAATKRVELVTNPNLPVEGAAGSLYKRVPTVLVTETTGGARQTFYGCYTLRKSNLRPPDIPQPDAWRISAGELKPSPDGADTSKLLAEACGGDFQSANLPDGGGASRILGALDSGAAEQSVRAPAAVDANEDFEIAVTTSGNGCVSQGETEVVLSESSADVFVYDLTAANRPGIACTMILKRFEHKATLRFAKKGEAVIRVWARRPGGGGSPLGAPAVLERRVTVR